MTLESSAQLPVRQILASPYIGRRIEDSNLAGDVGDSEYGLKAETRAPFGEGSIGDFNAIIAAKYCAVACMRALAQHLRGRAGHPNCFAGFVFL